MPVGCQALGEGLRTLPVHWPPRALRTAASTHRDRSTPLEYRWGSWSSQAPHSGGTGCSLLVRMSVACMGPPFKSRTYLWNSISHEKEATTDPTPTTDRVVSVAHFSHLLLLGGKKPISKGYVPHDSVYKAALK